MFWAKQSRFIEGPKIPVDNNPAERALRVVALGGKNDLFAGTNQIAENLAGLYAAISTCEACGVYPTDDIAELLCQTTSDPASKLGASLPHRWQPPA